MDYKYKETDLLCQNKYGTYIIPASHKRPVTYELKRGSVYEPFTIEFIQKNFNNQSIVTAGTYIGDFLPAFKDINKVYAFEPVEENYIYANINKKVNYLNNVILENMCLSNVSEQKNMITCVNGVLCGGGSKIIQNEQKSSNNIIEKVKSVELDKYLDKSIPISIIQLDVEGHETEVLEGGMQTIEKYKPIIIVETKPTKLTEDKLLNMGYNYHAVELHDNKILYIEGKHNLQF
tara:strand:- start:19438 stop:20139 length:702 start_codon:yes stop_codon:yes gene_type:complete